MVPSVDCTASYSPYTCDRFISLMVFTLLFKFHKLPIFSVISLLNPFFICNSRTIYYVKFSFAHCYYPQNLLHTKQIHMEIFNKYGFILPKICKSKKLTNFLMKNVKRKKEKRKEIFVNYQ